MTNKKKRTFLRVLSTTAALSMFFTTVVASAHGEDVKRDYHPLTVNENGAEKIDKADLVTKEAEFNYNKAKEIFKVTFDKEKKKQEDTSKLRRKDKTGRYTQDEVRKWALSMHHKAVDVDGAFGAQCVDLIMDMYNKFGAYRVGGTLLIMLLTIYLKTGQDTRKVKQVLNLEIFLFGIGDQEIFMDT